MSTATTNRANRAISIVLRIGVITSSILILTGAGLLLHQQGGITGGFSSLHPEAHLTRGFLETVWGAWDSTGRGLIRLGLLVLVATPIARVVCTIFAFAAEREGRYVVMGLLVLGALGFGLFWGRL